MGNTIWRTEPISVEKLLDDLRVGVMNRCSILNEAYEWLRYKKLVSSKKEFALDCHSRCSKGQLKRSDQKAMKEALKETEALDLATIE